MTLSQSPATAALRTRVEEAIEILIGLLDLLDGDPDLEPGADLEPIDEREPDQFGEMVLGYADDGHGCEDQRRPLWYGQGWQA